MYGFWLFGGLLRVSDAMAQFYLSKQRCCEGGVKMDVDNKRGRVEKSWEETAALFLSQG